VVLADPANPQKVRQPPSSLQEQNPLSSLHQFRQTFLESQKSHVSAGQSVPISPSTTAKNSTSMSTTASSAATHTTNKSSNILSTAGVGQKSLGSGGTSSSNGSSRNIGENSSFSSSHLTTPGGSNPSILCIHVHDDARGVKKDFFCNGELLLKEMAYFQVRLLYIFSGSLSPSVSTVLAFDFGFSIRL